MYKEFKIRKIKLLINLLIGIIFIYLSNLLINNPEKYINFLVKDSLKIKIIGIVGLIFFGLASIIIFFLILFSIKKVIGIIIDQKGFYSNNTIPSIGLVRWKEVSTIKIGSEEVNLPFIKSKKNNYIAVILKKPEEFLKKRNLIEKMLFKQQYNKYGTPIILNPLLLKCTFDEFEKALLEQWKEFKSNNELNNN